MAQNVFQCCELLPPPAFILLPIYIYSGTPAAPLQQVKAPCTEREINSEQLEMRNSLAMFIILPSVLFCGSASKIWMHIQYLT